MTFLRALRSKHPWDKIFQSFIDLRSRLYTHLLIYSVKKVQILAFSARVFFNRYSVVKQNPDQSQSYKSPSFDTKPLIVDIISSYKAALKAIAKK